MTDVLSECNAGAPRENSGVPTVFDHTRKEQQQAEALGLKYVNVPLTITNINDELTTLALQFIDECRKPVLVHCGLRAGAMVIMHMATRQGMTPEQGLALAEQMDLNCITSPKINILRAICHQLC